MIGYLLAVLWLTCFASGDPVCPNYNYYTWIGVDGIDCYLSYVDNANLTTRNYCYSSIDFSLQTHVTLANPSAQRQGDAVGNVVKGQKMCAQNETNITYCKSRCMDKSIENALVQASQQSSPTSQYIFFAAQKAMKTLGKGDWPLLMIQPFEENSKINFQYYDDMNFCVMDILFIMPLGDDSSPFRSFFVTHKTLPIAGY